MTDPLMTDLPMTDLLATDYPMTDRIIIAGGTVVDPIDGECLADVEVSAGRITRIAPDLDAPGSVVIDATGRLVMPGLIDAHSHGDARILDSDVQLALLRQGVTSIIAGQDGVSFAPGDGRYASDYFGALNGQHPTYRGGGVGELLDTWQGSTRVNVGYLVPAGTVRHEVMGSSPGRADASQLESMVALVKAGLNEGALGLSSGLDYVPGCFADATELAALCDPVAEAGGVYVTHMRGYEEDSPTGFAEVLQICALSGVAAHISHFHAREALVTSLLTGAAERGSDVTFDAYPYFRGCTLLSMVLLPSQLVGLGNAAAGAVLRDASHRQELVNEWRLNPPESENLGEGWAGRMVVASAGSTEFEWVEGMTLADAALRVNSSAHDLALRLLGASDLAVTVVVQIRAPRTDDELARQFGHPRAMVGSDGIFFGSSPHPRGWGCFSRMLGVFARERGLFSFCEMANLMSLRPASRFGLDARGRVAVGAVADLILVDPGSVGDRARYDDPKAVATGIDDVLVNGQIVLRGGRLTSRLAGQALRRSS